MKIPLFVLSLLFVIILVFIKIDYFNPQPLRAKINGHVFSLFLARTNLEQEIGLARFNKIRNDQGMLFIFPESDYYSFWMKNMKFPIDIIFINKNKVVDIFKNVSVSKDNNLPVYTTHQKANIVLEINSGLSDKYKIKIDSKINISL